MQWKISPEQGKHPDMRKQGVNRAVSVKMKRKSTDSRMTAG